MAQYIEIFFLFEVQTAGKRNLKIEGYEIEQRTSKIFVLGEPKYYSPRKIFLLHLWYPYLRFKVAQKTKQNKTKQKHIHTFITPGKDIFCLKTFSKHFSDFHMCIS